MNPENEKEPAMPPVADTGTSTDAGPSGPGADAGVDGGRLAPMDVQAYIGRQLRAVYDDVVKQPIPDRFLALMKQLEEQDVQT